MIISSEPKDERSKRDSIPIAELLNVAKQYIFEVLRRWKWILLCIVLGLLIGYIMVKISKPIYSAEATFVLEQTSKTSLVSQFVPIPILSNKSDIFVDENRFLKIITMRRIISEALLKKAVIDGKNDFLINHFMDVENIRDRWQKYDDLKNISFSSNDPDDFTLIHNSVMSTVCYLFVKDHLKLDLTKEFLININVKSAHPVLPIYLYKAVLESMSDFYIEYVTHAERDMIEKLQSKHDSMSLSVFESEQNLAKWQDEIGTRLVKFQGRVEEMELRRTLEQKLIIYKSLVSNLEMSRFKLMQNVPMIKMIQEPLLPLGASILSLKVGLPLGGLLGAIIPILLVILIKLGKDIVIHFNIQPKKIIAKTWAIMQDKK